MAFASGGGDASPSNCHQAEGSTEEKGISMHLEKQRYGAGRIVH